MAFYNYRTKAGMSDCRNQANVASTELVTLEWLRKHFGGQICKGHAKNGKICWTWYACNRHAIDFYRAIRPYVLIKGAQIDEVLAIEDSFVPRRDGISGRMTKITDAEFKRRSDAAARIKALKNWGGNKAA